MKLFIILINALLCTSVLLNAQQLKSGEPIMSSANDGLAPMSFGYTYNNVPKGCAYLSSNEYPDIFVLIKSGTKGAVGFWLCEYDGNTTSNELIFKNPKRINTPWDDPKQGIPPTNIKVFQDDNHTYLIRMTTKKIYIAEWNGENAFESKFEKSIDGIELPISSLDIVRRGKNSIEIALLCNDGISYRPETFKGDKQSYYDGAGIYRGHLSKASIHRFTVDNLWNQSSSVINVCNNVTFGAGEIACVYSNDDSYNGYVVTNILGSMKFIPFLNKIPKNGTPVYHIMKNESDILVHKAYSSRVISVPSKKCSRSNLIIGGESAIYHYKFTGLSNNKRPIYAEPIKILQKDSPIYGGSLTVPNVVDWDGDGNLDIVAGNSEGRLLFFKNHGTDKNPKFSFAEEIESGGVPILLRPGYNIVQGPLEAAWGYLSPTVFDWNDDGLMDVVFSGSRAKFEVMLNKGTRTEPKLSLPYTIKFENIDLFGTWRVRPAVAKIKDRIVIVIMDEDNALHMYGKVDNFNVEDLGKLQLDNGDYITGHNDANEGLGQRGRGKLRFVDWDGDGKLDLLVGSVKRSSYPSPSNGLPYSRFKNKEYGLQVMLFRNVGSNESMKFAKPVQFQLDGKDFYLGAHSNAPEPCMLGDISNGPNLLVGCESGKFFFFNRNDLTTIGY